MLIIPLWRGRHPRSLQNAGRIFRPGFCTTTAHGGGRGEGWILMKTGNVNSTDGKKCHPQLARCTVKKESIFHLSVVKNSLTYDGAVMRK